MIDIRLLPNEGPFAPNASWIRNVVHTTPDNPAAPDGVKISIVVPNSLPQEAWSKLAVKVDEALREWRMEHGTIKPTPADEARILAEAEATVRRIQARLDREKPPAPTPWRGPMFNM